MDAAEAVEIFQHSVQKHKLVYSQYLGDGDTSSFEEVVKSNPYFEFGIVHEKVECVSHVQKRLRNVGKECKGTATPLSEKENALKKSLILCKIFME